MKISIVTTIYRTAGDIREFHRRAVAAAQEIGAEPEVIFVNDASPDNGADIAERLVLEDRHTVLVDLAANVGQHKALWTGMEAATGDLVAVLDGDLEEDPLWLAGFHQTMLAEKADTVFGVQTRPKGSLPYQLGRKLYYRAIRLISGPDFPRNAATIRLMNRRYVNAILSFPEREIWMNGIMHVAGFRQLPVPIDKIARSDTSYTLKKLLRTFILSVTAFSTAPLILIFITGVAVSAAALVFVLSLIVNKLAGGVGAEGWVSVMAAVLLIGGLNILFSGVIAIYVATIFLEVKNRPRSIVSRVVRSANVLSREIPAETRSKPPGLQSPIS